MKKSILPILLTLTALFLFSGCSTVAYYDKKNIVNELDINKKKVAKEEVIVKYKAPNFVQRGNNYKKPSKKDSPTVIGMDVSNLNNQVAKEFFLQYFEDVKISKNTQGAAFVVDSDVIDFTLHRITMFADNYELTMKLKVDVFKDDKKILSKIYDGTTTTNTYMTLNFSYGLTLMPIINIGYHKHLLWMYETMVKPDLLEALEKNK